MKPTHKSLRKKLLADINRALDDANLTNIISSVNKPLASESFSRGYIAGLRFARSFIAIAFRDYDLAKQAAKKTAPKATGGVVNNFRTYPHVLTPKQVAEHYEKGMDLKPDKTVIIPIKVDTKPLSLCLQEAAKTLDQQVKASLKAYSDFGSQIDKIGALMNKPVTIPVNLAYRSPKQPEFRTVSREEYEWAKEGRRRGFVGAPAEIRFTPFTNYEYQVSTTRIL